MVKKRDWKEEKRQKDISKQIQEKERREIIQKKRENEREEFYRRLENSKQKFADAQNNLDQVMQKQQLEKKVSFNNFFLQRYISTHLESKTMYSISSML